jgi:type I restriction enzyme, S subunit
VITSRQNRFWTQAPLGELALLKTGPFGSALHKSDYVAGGTPIVNPMHIVNGRIIPSDSARVGAMVVARLAEFRLIAGDVVLGRRGEMGRCAVVGPLEEGWLCGTGSLIIRSLGGVHARYLQRYLSSPSVVRHLEGESVGSTMVNLNQSILRDLEVPVPPLSEQKRIAEKLDALLARVDACRERLNRLPSILKRFRQAVLAAAMSGELTREWREERGLKAEWKEATLGSLLTDIRYGTAKKCSYEPQKTPVLRIPNVVDGTIDHEGMKYADFDEVERTKLALTPGDLLMIRSNGSIGLVGRTALVSERESGFLYAGYLIRLRADVAQARSAYLSLFLASPASRAQIEFTARSTTGVNNINTEEIRAFPVAVPPLEEQDEIIRRTGELLEIATRLERRLELAQARVMRITPSTLAKAFRGELVPQDPDDEPASELLARLRRGASSSSGTTKPKRGGTRSTRTKAKVEDNMLTRKDVADNHLSKILKERGALTAEALWSASQLEIDDFYDQLKEEEARGLLHESRGSLPTAPRRLEPAA